MRSEERRGGRDRKTKMDGRKTMAGERAAAEWKSKKSSGANSEESDGRDCNVTKRN